MIERLARASSRHPWRVIAIWIVALIASFPPAIAMFLGDVVTADVDTTRQTDSKRADELLQRAFPETRAEQKRDITEVVVVRAARGSIEDPAARQRVTALSEELRTAGATAVVTSTEGTPLVSRDGNARAVLVGLGFDAEGTWRPSTT
jgi:putative drug exporter of the RND superfamily